MSHVNLTLYELVEVFSYLSAGANVENFNVYRIELIHEDDVLIVF